MRSKLDALTVIDLLHRASRRAEEVFERHTGAIGLTARQYAILRVVSQSEGLTQTGIIEATGIDRSTIAEMIFRLRKKGLLRRRRSKRDARAYAVRLTEAGRTIIGAAALGGRTSEEEVYGTVRSLSRAQLRTGLIELIEGSEAKRALTTRGVTRRRRARRRNGADPA